jgi:hypothetical protein
MKTACWLLAAALSASAAERWQVAYLHDAPDNSEFRIQDLAFASPRRGMAAGVLEKAGKQQPYALATTDGGQTWSLHRLPEAPLSLYFLNEEAGWLVGRKSIWHTADMGGTWKKLGRAPDALRVYFQTAQRGWAVGSNKSVYETADGGATWSRVAAAAQPKTTPRHTVYATIAFANEKAGVIVGWSKPPRREERGQAPAWMDPESAPREWPTISILLHTRDGGRQWSVSETTLFGQITRVSVARNGRGLSLTEFFDRFDYASEVFRFDWSTRRTERAFRRHDRMVTDVLAPAEGPAYLAAIEPLGTVPRSPIPGKLKLLQSKDLELWSEMEVDYRAVARRAVLASPAPGQVWVATDTGMILHLVGD